MDRYKRVPVLALPLAIVALVMLALWPAGLSLAAVSALFALAGFGIGPMYPATTVIIQNAVLPHQLGIATGTLNFFRSLGGAIIVAAFAAIVLGGVDSGGTGLTLDKLAGAGASDFAGPFRLVFIAVAVFLALALVAIAAIEERPLRGPANHTTSSTSSARVPAE